MRLKRYKKFQKIVTFYERNYNFRKPFQILVDGTFAQAALQNKVNILEQFPKIFDCPIKIVTTSCVCTEVKNLGVAGAFHILKQYPAHKCGHGEEPVPASDCILSMISGEDRYFVCTQDVNLKAKLRTTPGIPVIYLHGNTTVLENPSNMTSMEVDASSLKKTEVTGYQKEVLDILKGKKGLIKAKGELKKKRKKKGGPNPLSCKKSSKKKGLEIKMVGGGGGVKKKSRKRMRKGRPIGKIQPKPQTSNASSSSITN